MKRLFSLAGALALAATLSACGMTAAVTGNIEDAPIIADAAQGPSAQQVGVAQGLADKLVGAVTGAEDRGARLCMIVAGVSEVMTDRVVNYDTGYAAEALGNIASLQSAHANFKSASDLFFETDIAYVKIQIVKVLINAGKDRVTNLISTFAGGFNVSGMLDRAKVAARQAEITQAFVKDIQNAVTRLNARTISAAEVEAACQDRIETHKARILSLMGAPGLAAVLP